MKHLPNVMRQSDAHFKDTPLCGPCGEDDTNTPAVMVVNDEPVCWPHAQEELL